MLSCDWSSLYIVELWLVVKFYSANLWLVVILQCWSVIGRHCTDKELECLRHKLDQCEAKLTKLETEKQNQFYCELERDDKVDELQSARERLMLLLNGHCDYFVIFLIYQSINQSINQSKQIYTVPCVASESEAGTRWSKQCQTVPSLTYGQKYREQFTGSTVKWERVPDSRGANTKGFGRQR